MEGLLSGEEAATLNDELVQILLLPPSGGHLNPEASWLLRSEPPDDSRWWWELDVSLRASYWYF